MKKLIRLLVCALVLSPSLIWSAVASADAGGGAAPAPMGGGFDWTMILMIGAMVAIFYFFMIRPESKKKKKLAEMRASLSVGDTITTIGGIIGKVVSIDDEKITFETSEDRVRVQVAKWAVSTVGKETEEPK